MKNIRRKFLGGTFFLSLVIFILGACVSQAPETKPESGVAVEAGPAAAPESAAPAMRPPPAAGLDSARFNSFPREARDYLETLAEAFRAGDREFLLAQGEAQFEKELRGSYDEETYLALLYRVGPDSGDTLWGGTAMYRLNPDEVEAIEYREWNELGPMLEISALLHMKDSGVILCGIMLVWRLIEPKILGVWP